MLDDEYYMDLALTLARSVKGQTTPNPPVGAVLVKEGEILGLGAHLKQGEPHAEVHALHMAGKKAEGSTLYVTLEPCCHKGKTPSCADLIVKRGVRRVVIATEDLNEKVSGKGIAHLKKAGIEVRVGVLENKAQELLEEFFYFITTGRPFVTMKVATSLDGKIATSTGESKWITNESARIDVHRERHLHDAILVGIHTVLTDDPSLTTRLPNGGKSPTRIILDTHLRTPPYAKVVTDGEAPTLIFVGSRVTNDKIARFDVFPKVEIVKMEEETIKIPSLLNELGRREITSVLVEGGAEVNDSFLQSGFINKLILYIAPKLIGGKEAPTSIGGKGIPLLNDVPSLEIESFETIGPDLKIVAKNKRI